MPRGGKREGAGRKKGSATPRTKARVELAATVAAKGITPLEVLLEVMREHHKKKEYASAVEVAIAAAPYVHPRLATVAVTGKDGSPFKVALSLEQAVEADAELERYRRERNVLPAPLSGECDDPQGGSQVPG